MTIHQAIYEAADLYDLAFSYRNFAEECAFLRNVYSNRRGRAPTSFLEIAAGPARHAVEMAAAGISSTGLDLVPEMSRKALELASHRGVQLSYFTADMTDFRLPAPVDLAACLLISATYLTTDEAFGAHLDSVFRALTPGGIYVLELPLHEGDMVSPESQRQPHRTWSQPSAHGLLRADWRESPREAGTLTHRATAKLRFEPYDEAPPIELEEHAMQREYRVQEVVRLAEHQGFRVEGLWGDWDEDVPVTSPEAWRLLVALERPQLT